MLCNESHHDSPLLNSLWPWSTLSNELVVCLLKRGASSSEHFQMLSHKQQKNIAHAHASVMMASAPNHDDQCSRCYLSRLWQSFEYVAEYMLDHVQVRSFWEIKFQKVFIDIAPSPWKFSISIVGIENKKFCFLQAPVKTSTGVFITNTCLTLLNLKMVII